MAQAPASAERPAQAKIRTLAPLSQEVQCVARGIYHVHTHTHSFADIFELCISGVSKPPPPLRCRCFLFPFKERVPKAHPYCEAAQEDVLANSCSISAPDPKHTSARSLLGSCQDFARSLSPAARLHLKHISWGLQDLCASVARFPASPPAYGAL